ncbi:AraC-like DNA-binding protein [Paenibacillus sp. DS2015]|uniref:helix-turn-helix transcriptional regulator n=1 Tax=Paenibacillus sp. DS2015 TaxID=3373917 RepID=UPI003D1A1847
MLHLLFREEAVLFSIDSLDAEEHRHHLLQIIYAEKQPMEITIADHMFQTSFVIIDTDVPHKVNSLGTVTHNLLVDPSSALYEYCDASWLVGRPYVCIDQLWMDYGIMESSEHLYKVVQGLADRNTTVHAIRPDNRRRQIDEALSVMRSASKFYTQTEMAACLNYSPSHFSRVFKAEYGVAYSSYVILLKLKSAFIFINKGYSLTHVAHEAGFSHSAHLAAVAKKTLGMSLTKIMKDSINLKVIDLG